MRDDMGLENSYDQVNIQKVVADRIKNLGKNSQDLTVNDLAPFDAFHTRGRIATNEMAALVSIKKSDHILDVGCGLGGTARYLAEAYGCRVTGLDYTEQYIEVGRKLTGLVGMSDCVQLRHGNALDLPFEAGSFDITWTEHVQMNIADKNKFYKQISAALKSGGSFLFHDVFRGPGPTPLYPVPWAEDETMSSLSLENDARTIVEKSNMAIDHWVEKNQESTVFFERMVKRIETHGFSPFGTHLLMGGNALEKMKNFLCNLQSRSVIVIVGSAQKRASNPNI
jgi:MPBQ/MSBQ methyltransferase